MKISSIDIETTGLDSIHQMIEFAIVVDDTTNIRPLEELPRLKFFIAHENYTISASLIALNKHYKTLEMIQKIVSAQMTDEFKINGMVNKDGELFVSPHHISGILYNFLDNLGFKKDGAGRILIKPSGKNVGVCDIPMFKSTVPDWDQYFSFSHRSLDVGPLFFDPLVDSDVPGLLECKKRAGLPGEVSHDAFDDAMDVIKLIRYHFKLK